MLVAAREVWVSPRPLTFCFLVLQRLQAKATLLRFPGRTSSSWGRAVAHSGILASAGVAIVLADGVEWEKPS